MNPLRSNKFALFRWGLLFWVLSLGLWWALENYPAGLDREEYGQKLSQGFLQRLERSRSILRDYVLGGALEDILFTAGLERRRLAADRLVRFGRDHPELKNLTLADAQGKVVAAVDRSRGDFLQDELAFQTLRGGQAEMITSGPRGLEFWFSIYSGGESFGGVVRALYEPGDPNGHPKEDHERPGFALITLDESHIYFYPERALTASDRREVLEKLRGRAGEPGDRTSLEMLDREFLATFLGPLPGVPGALVHLTHRPPLLGSLPGWLVMFTGTLAALGLILPWADGRGRQKREASHREQLLRAELEKQRASVEDLRSGMEELARSASGRERVARLTPESMAYLAAGLAGQAMGPATEEAPPKESEQTEEAPEQWGDEERLAHARELHSAPTPELHSVPTPLEASPRELYEALRREQAEAAAEAASRLEPEDLLVEEEETDTEPVPESDDGLETEAADETEDVTEAPKGGEPTPADTTTEESPATEETQGREEEDWVRLGEEATGEAAAHYQARVEDRMRQRMDNLFIELVREEREFVYVDPLESVESQELEEELAEEPPAGEDELGSLLREPHIPGGEVPKEGLGLAGQPAPAPARARIFTPELKEVIDDVLEGGRPPAKGKGATGDAEWRELTREFRANARRMEVPDLEQKHRLFEAYFGHAQAGEAIRGSLEWFRAEFNADYALYLMHDFREWCLRPYSAVGRDVEDPVENENLGAARDLRDFFLRGNEGWLNSHSEQMTLYSLSGEDRADVFFRKKLPPEVLRSLSGMAALHLESRGVTGVIVLFFSEKSWRQLEPPPPGQLHTRDLTGLQEQKVSEILPLFRHLQNGQWVIRDLRDLNHKLITYFKYVAQQQGSDLKILKMRIKSHPGEKDAPLLLEMETHLRAKLAPGEFLVKALPAVYYVILKPSNEMKISLAVDEVLAGRLEVEKTLGVYPRDGINLFNYL